MVVRKKNTEQRDGRKVPFLFSPVLQRFRDFFSTSASCWKGGEGEGKGDWNRGERLLRPWQWQRNEQVCLLFVLLTSHFCGSSSLSFRLFWNVTRVSVESGMGFGCGSWMALGLGWIADLGLGLWRA